MESTQTPSSASNDALNAEQGAAILATVQTLIEAFQADPQGLESLTNLVSGKTAIHELAGVGPELKFSLYEKAHRLYSEKNYRDALRYFTFSLLLDASFIPAVRGAAGCLQAIGDYERAAQFYLVLLSVNEFDFEVIVSLAATLEAAGKAPHALEVLQATRETDEYQSSASELVKKKFEILTQRCLQQQAGSSVHDEVEV